MNDSFAPVVPKFFNTAGPIKPEIHYYVDMLKRFDLEEIESLISQQKYFVLHAPRQTGKTSCMLALRDYLNKQGRYYAVYANVEGGQALRDDVDGVVQTVIGAIVSGMESVHTSFSVSELRNRIIQQESVGGMLTSFLKELCGHLDKPLVLFIDEIDSLVGDSLVSVLRQLRAGYESRPTRFPISVILCGVRDVRDYRIVQSNKEIITGGSAFNIKAESLRLGNFTLEEVKLLYQQHTDATGQIFAEECFPMIWSATEGQPWLVNALGYEVTHKMKENRDRSVVITPEMIYRAQEQIIYRRETHIDILIDKLREDRVRRVIGPILSNDEMMDLSEVPEDDIQYCVDLGLIVRDKPIRISNGIYREVIPRELTWSRQQMMTINSIWYIREDGSIDSGKLLTEFQQFFRQNADSWIEKFDYRESGPQLLLQAFLQRVVNGGGYIDREYGLGRGRTDLLIRKPLTEQYGGPYQYIALELKIKRNSMTRTINEGLRQTAEYMDRCPEGTEGHFLIFDRSSKKPWSKRIFHRNCEFDGKKIQVWGM